MVINVGLPCGKPLWIYVPQPNLQAIALLTIALILNQQQSHQS
ncbi:MAG: hypothetical protein V7L01_14870 [Nostoc sp.]